MKYNYVIPNQFTRELKHYSLWHCNKTLLALSLYGFGKYQCKIVSCTRRRCFNLFIILIITVVFIEIVGGAYILVKKTDQVSLLNRQKLEERPAAYDSIGMPCIEPHCEIDCSVLYTSNRRDGIIDSSFLSKIQQKHLLIDLGKDSSVSKLINFIPSPKTCPYRSNLVPFSGSTVNFTINFYPLVFGFADNYLPKIISTKVLLNNHLHTIDQICLPKKSKDFSELIPGHSETYIFNFENELEYRRLYSAAYYAITMKKSGWDCNRHYEIITSGTIPYFDKLDQVGTHTLSHLPKSLLHDAQRLAGVERKSLTINHSLFDIKIYNLILHRLLYYSKHRLTTRKLVEYILKVINYPLDSSQKHSVLYIAHNKSDYMKDYMLHGFTRIFEENLHVFQAPKFMYHYPTSKMWTANETTAYYGKRLYGFGYGYKLTLKNYFHLYKRDKKDLFEENIVQKHIGNKNYSLIVFGSIIRENKFFSFATQHYERSKIIVIDGEDDRKDSRRSEYAKNAYYFLREIPDNCDSFI